MAADACDASMVPALSGNAANQRSHEAWSFIPVRIVRGKIAEGKMEPYWYKGSKMKRAGEDAYLTL